MIKNKVDFIKSSAIFKLNDIKTVLISSLEKCLDKAISELKLNEVIQDLASQVGKIHSLALTFYNEIQITKDSIVELLKKSISMIDFIDKCLGRALIIVNNKALLDVFAQAFGGTQNTSDNMLKLLDELKSVLLNIRKLIEGLVVFLSRPNLLKPALDAVEMLRKLTSDIKSFNCYDIKQNIKNDFTLIFNELIDIFTDVFDTMFPLNSTGDFAVTVSISLSEKIKVLKILKELKSIVYFKSLRDRIEDKSSEINVSLSASSDIKDAASFTVNIKNEANKYEQDLKLFLKDKFKSSLSIIGDEVKPISEIVGKLSNVMSDNTKDLFFSAVTNLFKDSSWRLRERTVFHFYQLLIDESVDQEIIDSIKALLSERKAYESHDKVKLILNHPEFLSDLKNCIETNWESDKDRIKSK